MEKTIEEIIIKNELLAKENELLKSMVITNLIRNSFVPTQIEAVLYLEEYLKEWRNEHRGIQKS